MVESLKNTVIQGDCLDVMKSMPDKCIDLVLTDPPYGIGESKKKRENTVSDKWKNPYKKIHDVKEWDTKKPAAEYFEEIKRISKNQIIWGGNYFIENLYSTMCWLFWDKKNGNSDFSDGEIAWTSFNSGVRKFSWLWNGFQKEKPEERFHPTQKPLALFQWILQNYSQPGMTIFDPFSGSGTTAIACLETGRNYILVEKEPEYVDIINKRIDMWKEQGRLFPAHVI